MHKNNSKKPIGLFFYDKRIYYIHYDKKKVIIFSKKAYSYTMSLNTLINVLMLPTLHTFDGYKKAYHTLFNQKSLIPLLINKGCLLLPVYGYRNESNILLNIFEIKSLKNDDLGCVVSMANGQELYVNKTCISLNKQINKALFNHLYIK